MTFPTETVVPRSVPTDNQYIAGYTVPMAIFLALTALEGWMPAEWRPAAYGAKILIVTASLFAFSEPLSDIRPTRAVLGPAFGVGLLVFVGWVGIETLVSYPKLGVRTALNPFEAIADPTLRYGFIAIRLFGLTVVVPVMEELFWRSFLLRYVTQSDFRSLPFDGFSWRAFGVVAVLFALGHPEWLSAALTACVYAELLRRTRSIFATVVAHAVTNAALGAYILATGAWLFW